MPSEIGPENIALLHSKYYDTKESANSKLSH